jgi:hypothetical protein
MLSIDFGNTYTKVALRPDFNSPGFLLSDASLNWDELNACVPTLAACRKNSAKSQWYFGTDVTKFRETSRGLTVYRNWKPRFFEGSNEPIGELVAVNSKSKRFNTPPGLSDHAWQTICATLTSDAVAELWTRLGGEFDSKLHVEETELEHKLIALGFFRWLREFFDPVCRKRVGRCASEIPVRVSLPSFGSVAKAEELLREILSEAGWKLDDRVSTLPEPLSNAIGTFTEGVNVTHLDESSPHYGQMFRDTGLLARMREAILYGGPKTAWALIVDLGGYTADFAMVGLNLDDIESRIDGIIDGLPRLSHLSKALGVTDLDRRVRDVLHEKKRQVFDEVIAEPDQQRLETFHKNLYGFLGRVTFKKVTIGDSDEEKTHVREVVERFADEIAEDAEAFLDVHQYRQIDDLILTGGGTKIPAVREALCARLSHYGVQKVHLHMGRGEKLRSSIPVHSLKEVLVRGATAIGGASVYFDFADE